MDAPAGSADRSAVSKSRIDMTAIAERLVFGVTAPTQRGPAFDTEHVWGGALDFELSGHEEGPVRSHHDLVQG
jgi:hypothetical protein